VTEHQPTRGEGILDRLGTRALEVVSLGAQNYHDTLGNGARSATANRAAVREPVNARRVVRETSMQTLRRLFPLLALVLFLSAFVWAISFGKLPPADFTFNNDDEVKTIDPAKATGQPENRIINALFEGLVRMLPKEGVGLDADGILPLFPTPGCAELPEITPDGRTYTFRIRPKAHWSNGDPVTSHDFAWSWRRTLHPETAAEYAYQLYYISGAKAYNQANVDVGQRVEVELDDRRDSLQPFPRGTVLRGTLRELRRPPEPVHADGTTEDAKSQAESAWRKQWIFVVEVDGVGEGAVTRRVFATDTDATDVKSGEQLELVRQVLPDFERTVGVETPDERTLIVKLNNPTPFFVELVAFYPYFPVHWATVEKHGTPSWTKPENIVSNGPFKLKERRIRDRIRMVKNKHYADADKVQLLTIDALAVKYQTTALSMFLKGQVDWITKPPTTMLADLEKRPDFVRGPAMITYFYRLNVDRKPLNDVRVRRALNMAMDKQAICERVTRGGERPARSLVPPGMLGYKQAFCGEHDVQEAQRLLAAAGFPGGKDFPRLQILFNTHEAHRDIAEVIQQQWKQNLGIDIELRNLEWGVYLDSVTKVDFDIARAGWVPDYSDPNTFLDMFLTGGAHNNTHWGNPGYDQLIAAAGAEPNVEKRLAIMHQAEQLLMDELPIIPIYYYVTLNMVNTRVKNFAPNAQDLHPLHILRVDDLRSPSPAAARN